ncbi:hypothetical protein [Variovorax rhizosphaerae]|uniref:Uncharacterized protein n=1 Tax=Variovorax rhizosphaerae TaxID=1836200 RepID=A0ABU8WUB3_9BURK
MTRTVRHLRMRVPSESHARQLQVRLDDALRCASLPDGGERLLFVRRLDLGRMPEGWSAQGLSLHIERCVQAAGLRWVHGDTAEAAQAGAVWFASPFEAMRCYALRLAVGAVPDAWHWRLALPPEVLAPDADRGERLRRIVRELVSSPGAVNTVPALLQALEDAGHGRWARAQTLLEMGALLRDSGVRLPRSWAVIHPVADVPALRPGDGARALSGDAAPGTAALANRAGAPRHEAPRTQPLSATSNEPGARTPSLALVTPPSSKASPRTLSDTSVPAPSPVATSHAVTQSVAPQRFAPVVPAGKTPSTPHTPPSQVLPTSSPSPLHDKREAPPAPPRTLEAIGQFTTAGGLMCLVPVLSRLHFGAVADDDAAPLMQRLLQRIATRLDLPHDDATWSLAAALAAPEDARTPDLDARTTHWLNTLRRHLRLQCGIGLASLALRPGWLDWGPTHIDVHLPLAQADLRIRRAGLDIDPGWVAWLQRIVRFHYFSGRQPEALR